MVLDKLVKPQLFRKSPYLAVPMGFFFVLLAFVSTALVFPAEYSVIVVAFASLLTLPYVIKIFELDELNIDLGEIRGPPSAAEGVATDLFTKISMDLGNGVSIKREELDGWVRKCLRDGYTPQQIKRSLIENNLDKDILLLHDLGVLDEINARYVKESNFFSRHSRTVLFYCYLFLGMFLAFLGVYLFAGEHFKEVVFQHQLNLIYGPRGYFGNTTALYGIISNNLKVMLLCVFLSLFYGAGAILILTYNASIAGVLYGGFILNSVPLKGMTHIGAYLPHTTLEILAYLFAAVSGGILSKAFIGVEPGSSKLLLKDGLKFLLISIALILVSGFVEVTVPGMLLS